MDIVFKSYKQTDLAILFLLLFVFTLVMLHSQAAGIRKCTNSQILHNVTLITTSFLLLGWRSNLHVGHRQKKAWVYSKLAVAVCLTGSMMSQMPQFG